MAQQPGIRLYSSYNGHNITVVSLPPNASPFTEINPRFTKTFDEILRIIGYNASTQELTELQNLIRGKDGEILHLKKENHDLELEINSLSDDLRQAEKKYEDLKPQLMQLELAGASNNPQQVINNDLKHVKELKAKEKEKQDDEIQRLKTNIRQLEEKSIDYEKQILELNRDLKDKEKKLQDEGERSKTNIKELLEKSIDYEKQIQELNRDLKDKEKKLQDEGEQSNTKTIELLEIQELNRDLKAREKKLQDEGKQSKTKIIELLEKSIDYEKQIQKLNTDLKDKEKKLQDEGERSKTKIIELLEKSIDYEKQIQELKDKQQKLQDELEQSNKTIKELLDKSADYEKQIQELKDKEKKLQDELEQSNKTIKELLDKSTDYEKLKSQNEEKRLNTLVELMIAIITEYITAYGNLPQPDQVSCTTAENKTPGGPRGRHMKTGGKVAKLFGKKSSKG